MFFGLLIFLLVIYLVILFEQIKEEYPTLNENEQIKLTEEMFNDLCQS